MAKMTKNCDWLNINQNFRQDFTILANNWLKIYTVEYTLAKICLIKQTYPYIYIYVILAKYYTILYNINKYFSKKFCLIKQNLIKPPLTKNG